MEEANGYVICLLLQDCRFVTLLQMFVNVQHVKSGSFFFLNVHLKQRFICLWSTRTRRQMMLARFRNLSICRVTQVKISFIASRVVLGGYWRHLSRENNRHR